MQPASDRLSKLTAMLERSPNDTFLLYALALEHKKAAAYPEAFRYFDRVIANDPAYCAAYHQAAQTHELAGDLPSARQMYLRGIEAAARAGNAHAKEEMQAALSMLDG